MKLRRNQSINSFVLATVGVLAYTGAPSVAQDVGDDVRAILDQVNPSAWSKYGWRRFKWNMAPGDVKLVIGNRISNDQFDVQRDSNGKPKWITVAIDDVEFYGAKETAALKFVDARLSSIGIELECGQGPSSKAVCDEKYTKISDRLNKEFGNGLCEKDANNALVCQWGKKFEAWIRGYKAHDGSYVNFEYSNPDDKLFKFSFTDQDARVSSASWGPTAWANFRWGMGFDDVIAAAKRGAGPMKLKASLNCLQNDKSGEVVCKAKSENHEFRVSAFIPDIQFRFKGRRLAGIDLIQKYGNLPVNWKDHQNTLRQLLTEKYGAPIDAFEGGSYHVYGWRQDATRISLIGSSREMAVTYLDTQAKADTLQNAGGGL